MVHQPLSKHTIDQKVVSAIQPAMNSDMNLVVGIGIGIDPEFTGSGERIRFFGKLCRRNGLPSEYGSAPFQFAYGISAIFVVLNTNRIAGAFVQGDGAGIFGGRLILPAMQRLLIP